MRRLFSLTLAAVGIAGTALSQSTTASTINFNPKDSSGTQKFYFPVANYSDSIALDKAMPRLAEQVLVSYKDTNKRNYYESSINYYLLSGNYTVGIAMIDSIQKIDDNPSFDIETKSYARAKISEGSHNGSFEAAFKEEFSKAFNQLSFRKKVAAAMVDTSWITFASKEFISFRDKLAKDNKDTLSLEDARLLCDKYFAARFNKDAIPMLIPLMDARYRPTFPAIKSVTWAGVYPVEHIDDRPSPNMKYKLLFELAEFAIKGQENTAKSEMNLGLGTVARELNLHEGNGIGRKNIQAVVVVHGPALYSLMNNEKYKRKYGIDNPNIPLVNELLGYGVNIIVCGQAMTFLQLEMEDLVPGIKQALTAQTVISSYQLKNYVYYKVALNE